MPLALPHVRLGWVLLAVWAQDGWLAGVCGAADHRRAPRPGLGRALPADAVGIQHTSASGYGLFTIIVLGESVSLPPLPCRPQSTKVIRLFRWYLLTVAARVVPHRRVDVVGVLRHAGQPAAEPRPSAFSRGDESQSFIWGYGHFFVFGGAAAVGASGRRRPRSECRSSHAINRLYRRPGGRLHRHGTGRPVPDDGVGAALQAQESRHHARCRGARCGGPHYLFQLKPASRSPATGAILAALITASVVFKVSLRVIRHARSRVARSRDRAASIETAEIASSPTASAISSEPLPPSGSHPVSSSIHSRVKSSQYDEQDQADRASDRFEPESGGKLSAHLRFLPLSS